MSTISVGGRAYAVGLYWLERRGAGATARAARRLGRPFYVHHRGTPWSGKRTGFATEDADTMGLHPEDLGPSGLPALALALLEHLGGGFWMALVEDDSGEVLALVKARDGAVLADGDEVFESREAAIAAFERARDLGWALHVTSGVGAALEGFGREIALLDANALAAAAERAGAAIVLTAAATARGGTRRLGLAALAVAGVAAVAGLWLARDALLDWLVQPDPSPAPMVAEPEPEVLVSVDGAALIAACRQALIENPPFLPAWEIVRISCHARFTDPELAALRPELAGRPVLLVRWGRSDGHAEAIARRLAESHLSRWHAASVAGGRAWAAAPLGAVLRASAADAPSFLELRAAVDRALGTGGARVAYTLDGTGVWTVRIEDFGPLSRLGAVAGAIEGLEVMALSRGSTGPWRLEARPVDPERMTASRLEALGAADATAGPGIGSSEE
ncbi:MAG: hypothetical protein OXO52_17435 [Rhodospirillales bacterium]|nr:hypothetical protein [Rhodospirillales bacterium]MDE0379700.1 hypothetical protein [Rhodospirillales bacterium]